MSTVDEPLPVCDILSKSPSVTYNENNYQDLIKFVRDVVGADCWAVTVNEEQIFNSYVNTKTFKDHIIDDVYRDKIIENPHSSIFVHILCMTSAAFTVEDTRIAHKFSYEISKRYHIENMRCGCSHLQPEN